MKRKLTCLLLATLVIIVFAGCRTGTIYNVTDAAVPSAMSVNDVDKAILIAGKGLGWSMTVTQPGKIVGTLNLRSHQAVVDIPYTARSYSIIYNSSQNLNYDPETKSIHKNYTSWIQRLNNAIQAQLGGVTLQPAQPQ